MASEWPLVPLKEVVDVLTGFPFKGDVYLPSRSGVRVVRGDNVTEGRIRWGEKEKCWPAVTFDLEPYVLKAADLVIGMDGSKVGKNFATISVDDEGALLAQRVARLRAKGPMHQSFLKYSVCNLSFTNYVRSIHTGTSIPHISKGQIQSFEVYLPPVNEQAAIANALGALDDRIDHNRALATNLEAISRRLFKSWFVDFDPVRAKAAGEKPPGLADDIAALFPDRFVDSELGDVPYGWKVGKISDFSTNVRVGCTPSRFSCEDFYVGLEHFDRRCLTLWNGGSGDDATSNKSRFSKGDILFGKLRPYFHKVAIAPTDGICSTDILVIRCADSTYREFMYFSLFQDDVIQFVSDASGGTRMPRTNWATLAGFDCIVSSQPVACAFGEIVAQMIETMMQCVSENNALTKLRDILLPRLISGKLRVEDAESMIEETLA